VTKRVVAFEAEYRQGFCILNVSILLGVQCVLGENLVGRDFRRLGRCFQAGNLSPNMGRPLRDASFSPRPGWTGITTGEMRGRALLDIQRQVAF